MHHTALKVNGVELDLASVATCDKGCGAYMTRGPQGEDFVPAAKAVRSVDLLASAVDAYGLLAERCETCIHVRRREDDGEITLKCHRNPPVTDPHLHYAQFPNVRPAMVCGEWRSPEPVEEGE